MAEQPEEFQELRDQFKQMHDDLDKLAGATKDQTKESKSQTAETKKQTEEFKKQNKEASKGEKDAVKDRKSILKAMQLQLRKTQMEQGASMADVAAEHLAGGGGLGGAAKAAIGLKTAQFKHKFDPLNIVKKITGGSRLAVALAGKVMGRSEKSIRSFADLAPGMDLPTPFFGKGKGFGSPSKERGEGGSANGVLGKIAFTLTQILSRITNIETIERLNAKLTQEQIDHERDAAAEAGAKKSPSKFAGVKEKVKESTNEVFKFIEGLISKFKFGLLAAFALLGVAGVMLYKQWENLKTSFGLLKDSAIDMWEGVKKAFSDAGTWISDTALRILDTVKDMFDGILETVQDVLHTISFGKLGKKAPTAEERQANLEAAAKGGDERAQRKLAGQNTVKVAKEGESAAAVGKFAPSFASKIAPESKSSAAEGLKRGDYDAGATGALLGTTPMTGTPEQKATTGAVTQLVAKAYGEVFKDDKGNPLSPMTDTKENREKRVPEMVKEATKALGASLSTGTAAPTAVSIAAAMPTNVANSPAELPAAAPQTGQKLNQAAEDQRNAAAGTGTANVMAPVINQHKTVNNTSQTTINQGMPSTRSTESSFLRSQDMSYARP